MSSRSRLIPIYSTSGELGAYLLYPFIYNRAGDWIGWVTSDRLVYSVRGNYVGVMSNGPRILRKREYTSDLKPHLEPPPAPPPILPPAHAPLAPQMSEISINMIDVLDDAPGLLPPFDFGAHREDMD
jgi:hypothetical protein